MTSTVYSSTDLGLNKKYEIFLYTFPFCLTILPIATKAFEEKYNWCVTNPGIIDNTSWILLQAVVFMVIVIALMGRQTWIIYERVQNCGYVLPPRRMLKRILKGPMIYAIVTVLFGFVGVILIRVSSGLGETRKAYYVSYALMYLFFVPGFLNFFIFFIEKRHLMVS
jgi:hypothetical protein